jgi:hypothetical protein
MIFQVLPDLLFQFQQQLSVLSAPDRSSTKVSLHISLDLGQISPQVQGKQVMALFEAPDGVAQQPQFIFNHDGDRPKNFMPTAVMVLFPRDTVSSSVKHMIFLLKAEACGSTGGLGWAFPRNPFEDDTFILGAAGMPLPGQVRI